jgi:hypothetical protein
MYDTLEKKWKETIVAYFHDAIQKIAWKYV